MNFGKLALRLISCFMLALLLQSCVFYKPYEEEHDPLPELEERKLHLYWQEDEETNLYLSGVAARDSLLTGSLERIKDYPKSEKKILANLYLKESFPRPDSLADSLAIPVGAIEKLELYDLDLGKTLIASTLLLASIAQTVVIGAIVIWWLTKGESCPYVYIDGPEGEKLVGEIYSGAIFPSLERDDFLSLPGIQAVGDRYRVKLTNEVKEIQHTNLAELALIEHPLGTRVLADNAGNYHTIRSPRPPQQARSNGQSDILPLLAASDELKFLGDYAAADSQGKDTVWLNFARPAGAQTAKLVLRAKNSMWLDHALGEMFKLFGERYQAWYARQKKSSDNPQPNWVREQGITLAVSLKQDGEWREVGQFNVVGPVAYRDIVMPLDLSGFASTDLEIRLDCGALFWEIDSAALDFSPQEELFRTVLPLTSATDETGREVSQLLAKTDKQYYDMPQVGNQAQLEFAAPITREGWDGTVFLHSRGHYQILADPRGKPDIAYLKTFLEPGRFGLFSREKFNELVSRLSN